MSTDTPFLDPEVSELVREVLADPRAQLLSAKSRTDIRGRTELIEPVRPSEIGLTAAERHLVRAYREEVAWLLRQAAKIVLFQNSPTRPSTYLTLEERVELVHEADWTCRARRIAISDLQASLDDTALETLTSVLRAFDSVPPHELGATSMRLAPTDQARTCIAYDHINRGQHQAASHALDDILRGSPSRAFESAAHENRGLSLSRRGLFEDAAIAYRAAARSYDGRPGPVMSWFVASCRCGDTDAALKAFEMAEGSIPEDHPSVEEALAGARLSFGPLDQKRLGNAMDSVGGVCRRLLDELVN